MEPRSLPAAAAMAFRLSNTRRTWVSMSPPTSSPVAGSSGICPDTYTVLPTLIAWEYVPMAFGAASVDMTSRANAVSSFSKRGRKDSPRSHAKTRMATASPASGERAQHAQYLGHAADGTDDAREMPAVVHEQLEDQRRAVAVPLDDRDAIDVALRLGNRGRDLREHAHAVRDLDLDLDMEQPVGGRLPGDRHPFFRLLAEGRQVPAGLAMDHDATPARKIGEHRIVRYREATARVGHDQALGAGDRECPAAPRDAVTRIGGQQPARDERGDPLAEADLLEELLGTPQPELLYDRLDSVRRELAQAERELLERLVQESPAQLHGLPALQVLEVLADRGARFCGDHEVRPGRIWRRALGGDDLDGLAVAKRRAQRHQPPIDLRRDAAVADVGVHGIGKVDAGRAARQAAYFALGREHVHLVREQVDLDALEKLLRASALLDLDELLQPLARPIAVRAIARVAGLVLPVRRDARLRDLVHVLGTDLHLDRHAVRTEQRRVQRLVAIRAGDGDVVLEPPGHRLVHAVYVAKRAVAGIDGFDQDRKSVV